MTGDHQSEAILAAALSRLADLRQRAEQTSDVKLRDQLTQGLGDLASALAGLRAGAAAKPDGSAGAQHYDEFLAVLAHELRNPLAPIRAAAALVRDRGRPAGRCPAGRRHY